MTNITNMTDDRLPPCPPWLNLDLVVPAAIRDRMAELTEAAQALGAEVRAWGIEAFKVSREYDRAVEAATTGVRADLGDLLSVLTGYDKLFDTAVAMGDDATAMTGDGNKPAWVDEVAPEYIGRGLWEAVS